MQAPHSTWLRLPHPRVKKMRGFCSIPHRIRENIYLIALSGHHFPLIRASPVSHLAQNHRDGAYYSTRTFLPLPVLLSYPFPIRVGRSPLVPQQVAHVRLSVLL